MQIGAVSFQPYIYNTNAVSSKSLNKISAISDDALDSKTDISALTSLSKDPVENMNPLKRGETLDFAGILEQQMSMSRMNAARVMVQPETQENASQAVTPNNPIQDNVIQPVDQYSNIQSVMGFDAAV